MPMSTDEVRKTVLEQGRTALDEARKPWLAAVGATELAYGQLREQLKDLPAELRKLRDGAGQIDAAQVRGAVDAAAGTARETAEAYATAARDTYETLAHRGELVVRRIRRSPEVGETFGKAEEILSGAEKTVAQAGDRVAQAEEKVTRPAGTTRKAPARKTTPAKTTGTTSAKRSAAKS